MKRITSLYVSIVLGVAMVPTEILPLKVQDYEAYLSDFKSDFEAAFNAVQDFNSVSAGGHDVVSIREYIRKAKKSFYAMFVPYQTDRTNFSLRRRLGKKCITIAQQEVCIDDAFFTEFENKLHTLEVAMVETEAQLITKLKQDLQQKERDIQRIIQDKDARIASLISNLDKSHGMLSESQKATTDAQNKITHIVAQAQTEKESMQAEKDALTKELEIARLELKKVNKELADKHNAIKQLEDQIAHLTKELEVVAVQEKTIADLHHALDEIQQHNLQHQKPSVPVVGQEQHEPVVSEKIVPQPMMPVQPQPLQPPMPEQNPMLTPVPPQPAPMPSMKDMPGM